MKKITIIRDKKLFWLVITSIIYYLSLSLYNIIKLNHLPLESGNYLSSGYRFVILLNLGYFIFYIILLKQIISIIKLSDKKFSVGFITNQTAYYNIINKVRFSDKIEISFKNISKKMKIKVLALYNNEDKYKLLIDNICNNSKLKFNPEAAIKSLSISKENRYKGEDDQPIAFGGWLKLLLVYLIFGLIGYTSIILSAIFSKEILYSNNIHEPNIIASIILLLYGLYMMTLVLNKHKKSVSVITIYLWLSLILMFCANLCNLIFINNSSTIIDYINVFVRVIPNVLSTLIIIRYLETSKRVKNTFINNKLFAKKSKKKKPPKKFKITIGKIAALIIIGFILYVGIIFLQDYTSADKNVYKSVDEIIDTKYKNEEVEYFGDQGYYYLITGEYAESRQLVWEKVDNEYIYVNGWHKETQSSRRIYEILDESDLSGFIEVYKHNEKFILLINIRIAYQPVKIFDSYGELKSISISDKDFYFSVIDKNEIIDNYKLSVQYGDEIVYTATPEDFEHKNPYRD